MSFKRMSFQSKEEENSMLKKLWMRLLTVGFAVFVAVAMLQPAPASAARKKVLNIAHAEPQTLDPHKSVLGTTQPILRFLYRGMTRFAIKNGRVTTQEVEPDLAKSWTVSEDGKTWTFKLRKGVKFHHGFGEMTADDVKFSFERQIKRTKGTRFAKNLSMIKEMRIIDPYTIQIILKNYDPVFPLRMVGYQQGYIVSKKAVEKYGEDFDWNPVGTGPFYFVRHIPREKIILRANKDYYFGRPQIDEVDYYNVPEDATKLLGLEKGTFDLIYPSLTTADVAAQVKKMGAVLDRRGPGGQYRIYFNYTKPPFDNIKVRLAFMHAIDRKQIRDTLYPGELGSLATSPLPEGYFGHIAVEIPEYNPELAKKLLAEAGYPNGMTIKNYFITKYSGYPKIMVLVQEQLKKVGVNLELQLVEHATYHGNIRKNLNPFVLYGGTRLTDGDVWLQLFFHSSEAPDPATGNKGTNFSHYNGIDKLLEEARTIRVPEKRAAMYHEAQRKLMRDAVVLPILNLPNIWARNPKRVSTPFCSDMCEFGLHYGYNYPEMFKILD
jgi:peptide/nickel transport system substrate-binding protein